MSYDNNPDKYDAVKNVTGVMGTRDAANVAGMAAIVPGFAGNVFQGAEVALRTSAEEGDLLRGVDDLAKRLKIPSGQLMLESWMIRSDHKNYTDGSLHLKRYAGFGTNVAVTGAGAMIGGAMGSFVPVVGTMIGAGVGGFAFGYGGSQLSNWMFPEGRENSVAFGCDLCNKQNERMLDPEGVLRLAARLSSPYKAAFVEQQAQRGNKNGEGLESITEEALAPLLSEEFYTMNRGETACEFVARECNEQNKDIAQLFRGAYAEDRPPPMQDQGRGDGRQFASANNGMQLDRGFDERSGGGPGNVPMGIPNDRGVGVG